MQRFQTVPASQQQLDNVQLIANASEHQWRQVWLECQGLDTTYIARNEIRSTHKRQTCVFFPLEIVESAENFSNQPKLSNGNGQ